MVNAPGGQQRRIGAELAPANSTREGCALIEKRDDAEIAPRLALETPKHRIEGRNEAFICAKQTIGMQGGDPLLKGIEIGIANIDNGAGMPGDTAMGGSSSQRILFEAPGMIGVAGANQEDILTAGGSQMAHGPIHRADDADISPGQGQAGIGIANKDDRVMSGLDGIVPVGQW